MVRILSFICLISVGAHAVAAQLHTSGQAELSVEADLVQLVFKLDVLAETADQARQQVDELLVKSKAALVPLLSESDRLEASQLSLRAEYQYRDRERQFVGYKAERSLIVELTELAALSAVLDTAMSSGVNQLSGMNYSSSKASQHLQQVRAMAIEDSFLKAEHLATGYQSRLGSVLEVRYQSSQPQRHLSKERALMAADSASAAANTYSGAQITYFDRVEVSFELDPIE